jgi:hypothetical protein
MTRSNVIILDGPAILDGIAYHLKDNGAINSVDARSFTAERKRLLDEKIEVQISRCDWRLLSNNERLGYLGGLLNNITGSDILISRGKVRIRQKPETIDTDKKDTKDNQE